MPPPIMAPPGSGRSRPGRRADRGEGRGRGGSAAGLPLGSEAPMSPPPLAVVSPAPPPLSIGELAPPLSEPRSSGRPSPEGSHSPAAEAARQPASEESADIGEPPPPRPGDMPPAAWASPPRSWPAVLPVVAAGADNAAGSTAGRAVPSAPTDVGSAAAGQHLDRLWRPMPGHQRQGRCRRPQRQTRRPRRRRSCLRPVGVVGGGLVIARRTGFGSVPTLGGGAAHDRRGRFGRAGTSAVVVFAAAA
jgi:hypothetical protein